MIHCCAKYLLVTSVFLWATAVQSTVLTSDYRAPAKLNENWQFYKTDSRTTLAEAKTQEEWVSVDLPHTPHIEPLLVNDQWQGDAWYRYELTYDPAWKDKLVFLDFEGAMRVATVWINGEQVAHHLGGYLPFTAELTDHLREGANTVWVRLDNRDNRTTGPKPLEILDFSTYGGIYRNVWLRVENPVHMAPAVAADRTASGGVFVTYPQVSQTQALVNVKAHVFNRADAEKVAVVNELSKAGKIIARAESRARRLKREGEFESTLRVDDPELWHPEHPNLYDLNTYVLVDDTIVDQETTRIGIRRFEAKAGSLTINGEPFFLRGVNRHQEYPYIGYALSEEANYRDAERIKQAGFDYVRLSHYPHSTSFIKAADELGLVLIDAILGWQYSSDDPAFTEQVISTCEDMIRRDRNHASIFAWECSLNESDMSEVLIDRFKQTVHREYPGDNVYAAGWVDDYDIFLQARQHRLDHYQEPTKPYIVSEYGDWEYYAMNAGLAQDSWSDLLQEERSSRQLLEYGETRLVQQLHNIMEAHNDNYNTPAIGDGYWVMYDYNRGYADDLEASGVMSIDRRPKFTYHFFRSQRAPEQCGDMAECGPMVFIASLWSDQSSLKIPVLTNAEQVKLYLNGREITGERASDTYGNLDYPPYYFEPKQFEAGTLKAVAYIDGKPVAEHRVTTPGKVHALNLRKEPSPHHHYALGDDYLFIYADLVDRQGQPTRTNNIGVSFEVDGAEVIGPTTVHTKLGTASVLVRTRAAESLTVRATATQDGVALSNEVNL